MGALRQRALAAAGLAVLLLRLLLDWSGWATTFFAAAALFVVVLTVWSFAVEGAGRPRTGSPRR